MPNVAVVTDTTAYLPADLARQEGIHLVSLYVNWAEGSEREADMPDFDGFYDRLRTAEQLPTTSQPSIGDFLEVWEPLLDQGSEIVSIHISGALSGTVESARQARDRLGDRGRQIEVVDSTSGCGGLGLLAIGAARAAAAGAAKEAVAERAMDVRAAFKMWFAVDTLEYLRRGGRIGAASAWVGTALKIKPILTLEAEITPIERVRTSGRALARLTAYAQQRRDDGADAWVVQHIQSPEEADRLVRATEEIMGVPPVFTSEIGPVIGAHVGPGLLGVGGVPASVLAPSSAAGSAGLRARQG
jgi:DegV family protein with EDD domain